MKRTIKTNKGVQVGKQIQDQYIKSNYFYTLAVNKKAILFTKDQK